MAQLGDAKHAHCGTVVRGAAAGSAGAARIRCCASRAARRVAQRGARRSGRAPTWTRLIKKIVVFVAMENEIH
eukprot:1390325-Prymnesium_polylepis.1